MHNYLSLKTKKGTQGKVTLSQNKHVDLKQVLADNQKTYKRFVAVEKYTKKEEKLAVVAQPESINSLTTFTTAPSPQEDTRKEEKIVEEMRLKKKQEVEEANHQRDLAMQEMNRLKDSLLETRQAIKALEDRRADLEKTIEETTKELKAKDIIAASFSGVDEKRAQVEAMQKEVEELEREWIEAEEELKLSLSRAKRQFDEKRKEVELKQEKIEFYEENYSALVKELKLETAKRESLIHEYKNMAKDMKREQMAQMIEETKVKCKESEKSTQEKLHELKALNSAISKLDQEITYLTNDVTTRIGEGEDKKKKDNKSFDKMRAAFEALSKTHTQTKSYMEKFVELKAKNKQLQDRVMELKRNKYQEISDKLKRDLGELERGSP